MRAAAAWAVLSSVHLAEAAAHAVHARAAAVAAPVHAVTVAMRAAEARAVV
jgi:hypothetical protein